LPCPISSTPTNEQSHRRIAYANIALAALVSLPVFDTWLRQMWAQMQSLT
jgi:hypothetical protein